MEKFKQLKKIKEVFARGENIIKYLKNNDNTKQNSVEDILISYDFQAGSYIKLLKHEFVTNYSAALAKSIENLGTFNSIMEAGVGEATTLGYLIKKMQNKPNRILGFDISWSRLKFAKYFLNDMKQSNATLFTANLFEIPLLDNSIDVVFTSHAIEPNGGKEKEALKELYRVTGKYLILLEPAFEFADDAAKARMKEHGYITQLYSSAIELGYKVITHQLFDYSANPLNPTGLIIIEKKSTEQNEAALKCPVSLKELMSYNDGLLYSKESLLAYPVIDTIPCLLKENAILLTHLLTDYNAFKAENKINVE